MALRRVPGSRTYQADDDGLRAIGSSPAMSAEMVSVAQRIAGNAEAVGHGDYEAEAQTVTAGWQNERRSGAVVRERRQDWKDWRDATLVRVLAAMEMRGR